MTSNARNILSLPIHKRLFHSEGTCQSTASLLFMITPPPFSWIFTKYGNEWPPRKKNRKGSTRKKINTKKDPEVVNTKKDPEVVNTKKKPEVVNTKKKPEVARDLWPLTRDLCLLTLTRKRPHLTTHHPLKCYHIILFPRVYSLQFPLIKIGTMLLYWKEENTFSMVFTDQEMFFILNGDVVLSIFINLSINYCNNF